MGGKRKSDQNISPPLWGGNDFAPQDFGGETLGFAPQVGGKPKNFEFPPPKFSFPPQNRVSPPKWGGNTPPKQLDFGGETSKFPPQTTYLPPKFPPPQSSPPKFPKIQDFGGDEKVISPPVGGERHTMCKVMHLASKGAHKLISDLQDARVHSLLYTCRQL